MSGRMRMAGMRIKTCLVKVRNKAILDLPMAWKKLEAMIWKPITNNKYQFTSATKKKWLQKGYHRQLGSTEILVKNND